MHYAGLVQNWIVQINFGLKPQFGISFGLKPILSLNFFRNYGFRLKLKPNALSLYFLC